MGYNTDFYGSLTLDRGLDAVTLKLLNDVFEGNYEDKDQPSSYCDLMVCGEDNEIITWNGSEKTYDLEKWIAYICDKILAPRLYVLNGELEAQGEEFGDNWEIVVKDNVVTTRQGRIVYE